VIEILIGAILVYYVCLHGLYALLIALGATQLRRYQMGVTFGEYRRIAESPLTMPISLVIPAYNEEMVIVNTVLCALKLRYPQHEVIVVNDGSGDKTVAALVERFGMRSVRKVGQRHFATQPVSRVFVSSAFPNLVVDNKEVDFNPAHREQASDLAGHASNTLGSSMDEVDFHQVHFAVDVFFALVQVFLDCLAGRFVPGAEHLDRGDHVFAELRVGNLDEILPQRLVIGE